MVAGRKVNGAQIKELHRHLNERSSLTYAAMKAGMDRKTGGQYRGGGDPGPVAHTGRTRPDPLVAVWPRLAELLEREPRMQAKTLVEWLEQAYPASGHENGDCEQGHRRFKEELDQARVL